MTQFSKCRYTNTKHFIPWNNLPYRLLFSSKLVKFKCTRRIFKLDLLENKTFDEQNFVLFFQFILALTLCSEHPVHTCIQTRVYRVSTWTYIECACTWTCSGSKVSSTRDCMRVDQVQHGRIIANGRLLKRYDFFDEWNHSAGRPIPLSIVDRFVIENA